MLFRGPSLLQNGASSITSHANPKVVQGHSTFDNGAEGILTEIMPFPATYSTSSSSVTSWTKSSVMPIRSQFKNHKEWLRKWKKPDNTGPGSLPMRKEDIKGVHSVAYGHLYRTKLPPILFQNNFFSITFFPVEHHLSLVRKSNVALMFTLKGGVKLNDSIMEAALRHYKGKYRTHPFLHQAQLPMDSACRRSKYRKYIRKFMVDALHNLKTHKRVGDVAGVYYFRFKVFPTSGSDLRLIKHDIHSAFVKVLEDDAFNKRLVQHCLLVNGMKFKDMLNTCQRQKSHILPLMPAVAKFPFINDTLLLFHSTHSSPKQKSNSKSKAKKAKQVR